MKKWFLLVAFFGLGSCVLTGSRHEVLKGSIDGHPVSAPVKIVYDRNGVAHILAETDTDLYYGLGYAMAQDRFFFMDLARRLGRGDLSALFGRLPHYKVYDIMTANKIFRSLGFSERAEKAVAELDPESRSLLRAYSDGINRYLKDSAGSFPEYRALKLEPEPWRLEDCFVVADFFGLTQTAYSLTYEYYGTRLVRELGPERARLFLVEYPKDAPYINQYAQPLAKSESGLEDFFSLLFELGPVFSSIGSNNWVVDGTMSASGRPLLSNDPHIPVLIAPTFWYHVHLKGGSFDVAGMMFSGCPVFGAGSNGRLAWGITNARGDYIDLFREKLNPDNPNQYFYKGEWKDFEIVNEQIAVKGRKPVRFSYRKSVHGPIIEKAAGYTNPEVPGEVLALHLSEVEMARFFKGYLNISRSKTGEAFKAAVKDMSMGPFAWNQVYATADGEIGYLYSGHIARRPDGQGVLARSGTGEADWGPWIPFEELPHLKNPAQHFIVTANNKVEGPGYKYYLSAGYIYPSRATRITEMLEKRSGLTPRDMVEIQTDVKVMSAPRFVPLLLQDLESSNDRDLQLAAELLREWQNQGYFASIDSRGTCIYKLIIKEMVRLTFDDELGRKLVSNMGLADMPMPALWKILPDPENIWFDDQSTRQRETRREISQAAARSAVAYLRKHLGRDSANWKWGNLQKLYIRTPLGFLPWNKKPRLGPFPRPGTEETVNNSAELFFGPLGYLSMGAGTSRLTVDMAEPRHLYFHATTGNSENPDSPLFANTTRDWLNGEYRIISMDESEFRPGAIGELVILPQ